MGVIEGAPRQPVAAKSARGGEMVSVVNRGMQNRAEMG
jgi:hypothetical protein